MCHKKSYTDANYLFFSTPLRGFIKRIFFVKSIIVTTSSGAHFLRSRILESRNFYLIFLTTLRGFFHVNFLEGHNYRTHHSTDLIRYSFFLLSNSLEKQSFYFFSSTALRGSVERKFSEKLYPPYRSKQT